MEVTAGFGATGIYKGNALVVDDRAYVEAARSIEKNIRFLMAFYPLVLALMMVTGYIVSCLVMQDRRMELAVMRALGTGRRRVFFQIFSEHVLMRLPGVPLVMAYSRSRVTPLMAQRFIMMGPFSPSR